MSAEHHRLSHSASLIDGVQGALGALSESDEAMISQLAAIISKLRSMDQLHSTARKFRLQPETLPEEHDARRKQLAVAELDAAADLDALNAVAEKAHDDYLSQAKTLSKEGEGARASGQGAVESRHRRHAGTVDGGRQLRRRARAARGWRHERSGTDRIPRRGSCGRDAQAAREGRIGRRTGAYQSRARRDREHRQPDADAHFRRSGYGHRRRRRNSRASPASAWTRSSGAVRDAPAQVAARGDQHFQVAKSSDDAGGTVNTVTPLDKSKRIEEVARMLGGIEITATTRKHAKEMLAA